MTAMFLNSMKINATANTDITVTSIYIMSTKLLFEMLLAIIFEYRLQHPIAILISISKNKCLSIERS